jgi:3-isopropylmalate dehydrogenase
MMLDWLGERHRHAPAADAGRKLTRAIDRAYAEGRVMPRELRGADGTAEIARAVLEGLA